MSQRKVKILESEYDPECSLMLWKVRFLDDNNEIRLAWRASDIKTAFGIQGEVTEEHVKLFANLMKNKEVNLTMEKDIENTKPLKEMSDEELKSNTNFYHKYPFWEAYQHETKNTDGVGNDQIKKQWPVGSKPKEKSRRKKRNKK